MAQNSKIEWTDHTVNLWWGCEKVHTGCKNCYAETLSHRWNNDIWGKNKPRKRIKSAFNDLDKYQRKAEKENTRYRIFCGSMMDIFEKSKKLINPTGFNGDTSSLRKDLFSNIETGFYPNLVFLFLTKRPDRIRYPYPTFPKNIWFGTSISDQKTADKYVDKLRDKSRNNFLSIEPQIGPINDLNLDGINWVIQGGESGPGKRPFDIKWAERMRDICKEQNVPYFFKQIDKVQPIPEHLMIRELPEF